MAFPASTATRDCQNLRFLNRSTAGRPASPCVRIQHFRLDILAGNSAYSQSPPLVCLFCAPSLIQQALISIPLSRYRLERQSEHRGDEQLAVAMGTPCGACSGISLGCRRRRDRRRSTPIGIAQMPPATEGLVELNDYQPAVEFRLRQGVFGGNQLLLRLQNLEIAGLTSHVTLLRDFHRGLICFDSFHLAVPDGLQFLARDERVRNIAKRGQRRLFVLDSRLLPGRHRLALLRPQPAALPDRSGEASFSGFERLRLPPQIGPQPTHPVRQNIARHSEVSGDVAVSPTVYDPALQQRAVAWVQFPEKGAKSVTSHGLHWGDLGHITGSSVAHLIDGHRAAVALVFPVLPFPSDPFRPSTYLGPGPSARERPRNTKTGRLLARGRAPGRMGFRWNPLWPGVGIIAASFAAGTCCPGGERVALQSRGTLRWRSSVVTGSR